MLTEPVPAEGLEPGDVGTVVHVYADGKAYEVEFVALTVTRERSRRWESARCVRYPATT